MPKLISDDGSIAHVQLDDGSVLPIAKNDAPDALSYLQPIVDAGANFSRAPTPEENLAQRAGVDATNPDWLKISQMALEGNPVAIGRLGVNRNEAAAQQADAAAKIDQQIQQEKAKQQALSALTGSPIEASSDVAQVKPSDAQVSGSDAQKAKSATDALLGIQSQSPYDVGAAKIATGLQREYNAQAKLQRDTAKAMEERNKVMDTLVAEEAQKRQAMIDTLKEKSLGIEKAIEDARNAKVDGWANATTGTKVLAGIAIALGGFGQAFQGGENQGLKVINQAIDRDIELQKINATQKQQYASNLVNSYNRMRELGADDVQATLAMKVNALERTKMKIEQMGANSQSEELQGKKDQLLGQLDLQIQKMKEESQLRAIENFQKMMNPNLNSTQYQAAEYGQRMAQAENNFRDLENKGFDRASYGAGLANSILPGAIQSENVKLQDQAERNFINAKLRRESGAAISASEFESAEKQYFPRPGDSPAVKEQKRQNRLIALRAMQAEAGPAFNMVGAAPEIVSVGNVVYQRMPDGNLKRVR